jgi:hypothetical protein
MSKKSSIDDEFGAAGVGYSIKYTVDKVEFSLTMESPELPFENTQEVLNAMQSFIDSCIEEGKDLFEEEDKGLH